MSDKQQLPNPSRRRLFTILTDRKAAGEVCAELGKIVHQAHDAAHDLAQLGQEMQDALNEAAQPPPPVKPAVSVAPQHEAEDPAAEATAAETPEDAAVLILQRRIDALAAQTAGDQAQTRALLEDVVAELKHLNEQIAQSEQSIQPADQAKAQRLGKARDGLIAAITAALTALAVRTVEAAYDGWVQQNLLPLLPDWVQRPWEAFMRGEQPVSPLPQPAPTATSQNASQVLPRRTISVRGVHVELPEMVRVPAGWFLMGSDKHNDPMAADDEMPLHWVWLDEFWIAMHPVTNEEYSIFVAATGKQVPFYWSNDVMPSITAKHPVRAVDWPDAKAYCEWLSEVSRHRFRLPTEAEWEKAARGPIGRIWPWGNHPPNKRLCNFNGNVGNTTPVGAFPAGASFYGVLDMAGNVWEWTSSKYKPYPYRADDGREAWTHRAGVVRGGSYLAPAGDARCAHRRGHHPPLDRSALYGFRVVASPFTSVL